MKKSLLSIVLAVAVAMTAFGAMFVMPAAALNGNDFLVEGAPSASDGMTYEMVDGALVITATAAGQELALTIEGEANLNDYPFWEASIDSEIPYDVALYDPNNSKWMFAAGDFCYNFDPNNGASRPIPASNQSVKFTLTGAYTWTGDPLPANAAVKSITFIAKEAGTITVSKCAMTDGMADYSLNTASYNESDVWDNSESLLAPADSWISKTVNDSDAVVTADGDALVFSNTAGNWPSAYVNFDTPYVVDAATTAIFADFSVKQSTTVYLYLNGKTADLVDYAESDFVAIMPADTTNPELGTGNYSGTQYLADILPEGAIAADGTVEITAISVFATGSAGTCVTVNALDLLTTETVPAPAVDLGDMDNDGDVDTYDALIIFNAAAGYIELTAEETTIADMNVDDVVDTYDALLAFSEASGIPIEDLILIG